MLIRRSLVAFCGFALISCGANSGVPFFSGSSGTGNTGSNQQQPNPSPSPTGNPTTSPLVEHRIDVTVTAPAGVTPTTLLTVGGEVPLSGGSANLLYYNAGHQLAIASDAAQNPVLLGWVGPGETTLSSQTTAAVIMYFRLGGPLLTRDVQELLLIRLRNHAAVTKLATALETIFATDPLALTTNPPSLRTAVELAASELKNVSINRVLVDPVNGSGITVDTGEGGLAFSLVNAFRRRTYVYVQQKGFFPQTGDLVPSQPPRPVSEFELGAVTGVTSTFGTIANLLSGNIPYTPVRSEAVQVPVVNNQGQEEPRVKTAQYQVLVLGAGAASSQEQKLSDIQKDKLTEVFLKTFFFDFLFPIVNQIILPVGAEAASLDGSEGFAQFLGNTFPDLLTALQASVDTALPLLRNLDFIGAYNELAYSQVGGNHFRQEIVNWVQAGALEYFQSNGLPSPAGLGKSLERFAKVTVILDGILTVVDQTALGISVAHSQSVEEFLVSSNRGRVNISPYTAQVDKASLQNFTVSVSDPPEGVVFSYSLQNISGTPNGRLTSTNAAGNPIQGRTLETPSKVVTYIPGGSGLGKEKLVVEAIQVTPAPRASIASEEAQIEVVEANLQIVPRKASLVSEQVLPLELLIPDSLQINPSLATFEWNTTGGLCSFPSGASFRGFGDINSRINLVCTAPSNRSGTQKVSVKIFQPDTEGQLQIKGAGTAEYKVNEARKTILFGGPFGESRYSENGGFYQSSVGAGWVIPAATDEDQVQSYAVHIYNWTDGGPTQRTLDFFFTPQALSGFERITVPLSSSAAPFDGEYSFFMPPNGLSQVQSGAGGYRRGWTGVSGFGPIQNGQSGGPGPEPTLVLGRVNPSTVEVTVTYRP